MVRHGYASRSEAATAGSCLLRLYHRRLPSRKSVLLIALALENIPRANAVSLCWSCKMAGRFLSVMQTADQHAEDGQSLAEQKVFGGSPRLLRCATDCLSWTILFRTRSQNGRATHANHKSQSGSCSTRPTVLKALRVFNARRSA